MKQLFLLFFSVAISSMALAQTDTIYSNNEKIACTVKEITPDAVKYVFPNEEVINSVYKNTIQKIVFKSGRIQTFAEATSYKTIKTVDDYENVTITQVESEVKGLYKLGELSSKAKGTTTLSNQERVKERAYNKLKIVAAMMGANIIYLTAQRTEGNKQGGYYQSGSSAETNLSGVAYTNILPSFNNFIAQIGDKKNFTAIEEAKLWSSGADMNKSIISSDFRIDTVTNENGLIMIKCSFEFGQNKTYRVVSFDNEFFYIYYEDKSSSYNLKVRF